MDNRIKNLKLLEEVRKGEAIVDCTEYDKKKWPTHKDFYSIYNSWFKEGESYSCYYNFPFEHATKDYIYDTIKGNIMNNSDWVKDGKSFIEDLLELKKLYDDNIITKEEYYELFVEKFMEIHSGYELELDKLPELEELSSIQSSPESIPLAPKLKHPVMNMNIKDVIKNYSKEIAGAAAGDKFVENLFYGKEGRFRDK